MLTIFQDPNKNLMLLQTSWSKEINPLLNNTLMNGQMLKDISLVTGANTINHLLSRKMQGWMLVDINAAVTVYRSQPMNDKTLTLTASGNAIVSLWVF